MTTSVSQKYTPGLNVSITTKSGIVTRVSTWTTGVPKSTEVHVGLPKSASRPLVSKSPAERRVA